MSSSTTPPAPNPSPPPPPPPPSPPPTSSTPPESPPLQPPSSEVNTTVAGNVPAATARSAGNSLAPAAGQPLPRVSDALPVHAHSGPSPDLTTSAAAAVPAVQSAGADSNADATAQKRLLHSRFPSLSRIRSSRRRHDDTAAAAPVPVTRRRDPSTITRPLEDRAPSVSSSFRSRNPSVGSRSKSPGQSLRSVYSTDPDGSRPSLALPSSPPSNSAQSEQSKARSSSSTAGSPKQPDKIIPVRAISDAPIQPARSSAQVTGNTPLPSRPPNMHQTSSRLLRMTDDDRPFTRDFKDLFSTLMVSLPLTPHRVRFSKVEHTFTTEEAITNLGSLKFSQSNRMPDPKDPSRIVTTTTTTTFSMAKEMARSVCNKFLEARLVESCENKTDFMSKSAVWQLTPKGMRVLTRFCTRNGIHQRHVNELLDSPRNMMQLVILERDPDTDKINNDRAMIEVIFRRFAGETPNVKETSGASDTDSLSEYATGLVGVRCMKSSKPIHKDCPYIFTGKAGLDWLIDCCMVVDRRECLELANLFMMHDLINQIPEEKNLENKRFQPVKSSHYHITERGARLVGWTRSPTASISGETPNPNMIMNQSKIAQNAGRDSNTNRMTVIIRDPALRLLFREFLIETHCEENLTFYLEVKGFLVDYGIAKRSSPPRMDLIRENLASAYSLYNAFLAPGSPCELNIDHNLRNALAGRMTRAVGEDAEMQGSLDEVAVLFDQAQTSVFKLMASDSVPKFSRDPKYATVLRDRNLEHLLTNFDRHT